MELSYIEHNYTSADCGAHTIAYRDIEYIVEENTNNIEEGTEENDDISTFNCTSGTMDQGYLYADLYNVNTNTMAVLYDLPLTKDETNTTNVTCGTVSTITVVTDKDAVKVQLVYHKSGSTFTLPRDHANVVSLVEDGDNLIYIST